MKKILLLIFIVNLLTANQVAIYKNKIVRAGKKFVTLWSFPSKKLLWRYESRGGDSFFGVSVSGIESVDISPDGSLVVLVDQYDERLTLLDNKTGKVIKYFKTDEKSDPIRAKFSPNGKFIIATYNDKKVQYIDLKSKKAKILKKGHYLKLLDISPDSRYFVTSGWNKRDGNILELWSIRKAKKLMKFKGHKDGINDIVFSNDGKLIASASDDNTFIVWSIKENKALYQIKAHLSGSFPSVNAILFTKDDRFVITGGNDRKINLWDAKNGKLVKELYQSSGCIQSLDISEDGSVVVLAPRSCSTADISKKPAFEYIKIPFARKNYNKEINNAYKEINRKDTIEGYGKFLEKYRNEYVKYYPFRKALLKKAESKLFQKGTEELKRISKNKTKLIKFIESKYLNDKLKNQARDMLINLLQNKDTIQEYQWFIATYSNSPQTKQAITNIYKKTNKKNHLKSIKALSEISNQYKNNDMKNFTLSLLNKILNQYKTIDGYFLALDTLNEDTPNIKNIADELVKQIWIQVIEPSHDLQATIKFIREFKDANGAVISKAYDRAISLSNKELDKKYKKLVDSKTSFFFIKANQEEKEKIKEKIARQLFIEAVQSKDNGDEVTFSIKYHIATNNKLFKQTESAFNLYRDKEMKRFFQEQFKSLKDATRQSSSKIIDKLDEVNKKLDSLDETMSSSPTEAEIYEENRKFLMQSYLFDKAMKTHDGDE